MRARLRAHLELGRLQAATVFTYRLDYVFGLIGVVLQVFLLKLVWTSVYADQGAVSTPDAGSISLSTQVAYSTLASVQYWLLSPWAFTSIGDRIRDGKIAVDLVRPVPFLEQTIAGQVGATFAMAPFALVTLPVAILVGGAEGPASPAAFGGYVVSLVMAYAISTLLNTLVGLVCFWTLEVQGIFMIYRMVGQFFAGALVPLWFMPDWLRGLATLLPFQATTYTPLAIYLGRVDGSRLSFSLALQALWILAILLVMRLVWSRALRLVIVQGG
jgi:ABC-type uncharacterized transport system permease subunit